MIKKHACFAAMWVVLSAAGVALAQPTPSADRESLEQGQSTSAEPSRRVSVGDVVFSLEEMPRVEPRALEEMRASRLHPPTDRMREYLVRFQGLAVADALWEADRALRERRSVEEVNPLPDEEGAEDATELFSGDEQGGEGALDPM